MIECDQDGVDHDADQGYANDETNDPILQEKHFYLEYDDLQVNIRESLEYWQENELNIFQNNEVLKDLHIMITWNVCMAHRIETRMSSTPTEEQKKQFENLGYEMKKGPFSADEDDVIRNNFYNLCKEHDLEPNPTPFLNLSFGNNCLLPLAERKRFVQYLGRSLGNRKLNSIYRRFQVLFSNWRKGRFSGEEDKIIMTYLQTFEHNKNKFSDLSKILGRNTDSLKKRYAVMKRQENNKRLIFKDKCACLIKSILIVINGQTVDDLKYRKITRKEWIKVEELMDGVKDCNLRRFYEMCLKTRLLNKKEVKINKYLREIVERLYEEKANDWRALKWKELAEPYKHKHITVMFLYKRFKNLVQSFVPEKKRDNLRKTIKFLRKSYSENKHLMKNIKPIFYKDGEVIYQDNKKDSSRQLMRFKFPTKHEESNQMS